MDKTINRVKEMEGYLDECIRLNSELSLKLQELDDLREKMIPLFSYYGSEEWHSDRDNDLPADVKAGVLSEDLVYDEISKLRENAFHMLESATDILKNRI